VDRKCGLEVFGSSSLGETTCRRYALLYLSVRHRISATVASYRVSYLENGSAGQHRRLPRFCHVDNGKDVLRESDTHNN
jgi:hypothetical protein